MNKNNQIKNQIAAFNIVSNSKNEKSNNSGDHDGNVLMI